MSYSTPDATQASVEARAAPEKAQRRSSAKKAALTQAGHALANGALRDLIGISSEHLRLGLTVAANQLKRGAKDEAMRIYVGLVLCEPMNVDFQFGLANCAMMMREHHLALQAASVVIALEPGKPRGYYLSGRACLALGHFAEAAEDMGKALKFAKETKDADFFQRADEFLKKLSSLKPC